MAELNWGKVSQENLTRLRRGSGLERVFKAPLPESKRKKRKKSKKRGRKRNAQIRNIIERKKPKKANNLHPTLGPECGSKRRPAGSGRDIFSPDVLTLNPSKASSRRSRDGSKPARRKRRKRRLQPLPRKRLGGPIRHLFHAEYPGQPYDATLDMKPA